MTESTESIEQRLRTHFAEEGAGDGDGTEAALQRIHAGARGRRVRRDLRRTTIALTAVAASIVALVVVLDDEDDASLDTVSPSTTVASPTTAAPAVTSTTVATTTTTSGPPALGVDQAFIAYEFGVLGAWDGGAWRPPTEADGSALDGLDFSLVRLDEPIDTATATPAAPCELGGQLGLTVDLPWPETSDPLDPEAVAVSGVPDPRPRAVTVLDPASPAYRDATEPVETQIGVNDDDPDIVQLVRTDIEGDGIDEVFGVVERLSDPETLFAESGDYSAVFLRRVGPDEIVETVVIAYSVAVGEEGATPFVNVFRIAALVDANGDGVMELAVSGRYYEGSGMTLYDMGPGHAPQQALQGGCGA